MTMNYDFCIFRFGVMLHAMSNCWTLYACLHEQHLFATDSVPAITQGDRADLSSAMQAVGAVLGEEDLPDGVIAQLGRLEGADDLDGLQLLPVPAQPINCLLRIRLRHCRAAGAHCMHQRTDLSAVCDMGRQFCTCCM